MLVADSRGASRSHGRHSFTLDPPRLAIERNATRFGPSPEIWTGQPYSGDVSPGLDPTIYAYSPVEMRHAKLGNVLFVDTHARAMTLVQLGYQLSDGGDVPDYTAIPIREPNAGTYTATNRMWNGDGSDRIADAHRPSDSPPD